MYRSGAEASRTLKVPPNIEPCADESSCTVILSPFTISTLTCAWRMPSLSRASMVRAIGREELFTSNCTRGSMIALSLVERGESAGARYILSNYERPAERQQREERDDRHIRDYKFGTNGLEHSCYAWSGSPSTILYPSPLTVAMLRDDPESLSRRWATCTSTVRVSPKYS